MKTYTTTQNLTVKRIAIIAISTAIAITMGTVWWLYQGTEESRITLYDAKRDRAFILDITQKDRYWLSNAADFDPAFFFDKATPQHDLEYAGKLVTKVLLEKGKPVGFVSFYPKSFYEGYILFLSVDHAHRGKGYAGKLLQHAFDELFAQGIQVIRLFTRTSNHPAIAVYKRLGMVETKRIEGGIYFEKRAPTH